MKRLVLVFLAATICHVGAEETDINLYGSGRFSCGAFTLAYRTDQHSSGLEVRGKMYYSQASAYAEWIGGYITAQNAARPLSRQMQIDMAGVTLWIKKYCEENPTATIFRATNEFLQAHQIEPIFYNINR